MEKTISCIVEYAGKIADPISIYIFGSMASGSNDEFSDLDMLIITEQETPSKQISELIRTYAAQYCLAVDVLVYSSERFREAMNKPNGFVPTIFKNAKNVYKKS
jgi:predicted nucleotidyltransferase